MKTLSPLPLPSGDRAEILDALRGFALLGIILANYFLLSLYIFQKKEIVESLQTFPVDSRLEMIFVTFIEGKFYTIFSLLFGIGFSVILLRNRRTGKKALPYFYRRLFILAIIGITHALLVWEGDILLLYAILGMILPVFRSLSDKSLIILSICLILSPILIDLLKILTQGNWDISRPIKEAAIAFDGTIGISEDNVGRWLKENTHWQNLWQWNQSGFFWRWEGLIASNRIPKVLALFLLGYCVGRNEIFLHLEQHIPLLKKVMRMGFVWGIPASLVYTWFYTDTIKIPEPLAIFDTLFYALSVVPLGLAYAAAFALLWTHTKTRIYLSLLAPAGRMALTNYLFQSVSGVLIFYGLGLNLGGTLGPTHFWPIAIGVFVFQVIGSKVWLNYFQYGPIEWLWRQATYGRFMKLKKWDAPIIHSPKS
jgi:uncharacterized protein